MKKEKELNFFDAGNKIDNDLFEFFSTINYEKKKKKEKLNSIIGEITLDDVFEEITSIKKKDKIKKQKQNNSLNSFKKFLISETPDEDNYGEEILDEFTEGELDEQEEFFEDVEESENEFEEDTEERILIEKSLGLLSEPSDVKVQSDPITPISQKFATLEDLNKHYNLFLSRIQQQLSTLGGGGETRLEFLDDVNRNSVKVNHKFLRYDSDTKKWVGSDAGEGPFISSTTYVTTPSYAILEHDYYIGVNYAGAVTITLPTGAVEGTTYIVKDELGEASRGTNRYITVLPSGSDLIDGRNRAILAFDYGSLTFVYRNGWRVV